MKKISFLALAVLSNSAFAENPAYQSAVEDAALVRSTDISNTLNPIAQDNPRLVWNKEGNKLLVVSWKAQKSYEHFLKPYSKTSDNADYAVWVTAAPQVQKFCQAFVASDAQMDQAKLELRLKQFLGLNPDWSYDVFVEMWVSPEYMFRPCVDPEISDTTCDLNFDKEVPNVKNIPDYQAFYRDLYFKSFRSSTGVPWTGLGYTYDWGNQKTPQGASEYILVPETPYQIERVVPTIEYCGLK